MNVPQKVEDAIRRLGAERRGSRTTHVAAIGSLREVIEQDAAYARGVLSAHAARLLAVWDRAHPAMPDPFQAELFPGLPARLYVSPGRSEPVMDLTRYGVEMARNMLFARTSNQVTGATESARRERDEFMRLYDAVMPHMGRADTTVADALARRAGAA